MSTKNNGRDHGSKRAQERTRRRNAEYRRMNSQIEKIGQEKSRQEMSNWIRR
jgi:hypothetical protein